MATASNSRFGLAARRFEIDGLNSPHMCTGQSPAAAQLRKQLDEVKNATESTWDSVKNDFKKAYESSKDGFLRARQWVSEKIAP